MKPNFLVPMDFTGAADTALKHAINTAQHADAEINLLHMCDSKAELKEARERMEKDIAGIAEDVTIHPVVRMGDFKDIPQVADELGAELVFMGTHGATGMQRILGSNALKLVTDSTVPFIIVQENSPITDGLGYKKALVTASHNSESKQKIKAVAEISKYFDSEVILQYRDERDESLKIDTATNLVFMKNYLDKHGIKYEVEKSSGKNFNADTIELAEQRGADLITIMNVQMNTILGTGLFGPNYEQELLMNEAKIPVMIVSPRQGGRFGNVVLM